MGFRVKLSLVKYTPPKLSDVDSVGASSEENFEEADAASSPKDE